MRLILCAILFSLLYTSCKKDSIDAGNKTNIVPTNNTNCIYGGMSTISRYYFNRNTLSSTDSTAYAFFYSDPVNAPSTMTNCGNAKYNGVQLQNFSNNYISNSVNIHTPNSTWEITGSVDVPAINYTISPNYPIFNGNSLLPDSFSISNGFTISLNNINNFSSSVEIEVVDGVNSIFKTLPVNQTSYTFSTSELSILQPTSSGGGISLIFNNTLIENISGKNYSFTSSLESYRYNIKIKP